MLVNGQSSETISTRDRGLLYGDGVFETILCEGGRPILLAGHTQRLENGCKRLNLPTQTLPTILSEIRQVAEQDDCIVKVIVTRGVRKRGYKYDNNDSNSTRIVYRENLAVAPSEYYSLGVKLTQCDYTVPHNPYLAGVKHLNRLDQVIARSEWNDEYQEGVMLDTEGYVIEGTMTNIFVEKGNQWLTPRLDKAGVAGVMRQWILRNSYHADMVSTEQSLTLADIKTADAVFICNSVIGIWPVVIFADKEYSISPKVKKLMMHINANLSKYYSK